MVKRHEACKPESRVIQLAQMLCKTWCLSHCANSDKWQSLIDNGCFEKTAIEQQIVKPATSITLLIISPSKKKSQKEMVQPTCYVTCTHVQYIYIYIHTYYAICIYRVYIYIYSTSLDHFDAYIKSCPGRRFLPFLSHRPEASADLSRTSCNMPKYVHRKQQTAKEHWDWGFAWMRWKFLGNYARNIQNSCC